MQITLGSTYFQENETAPHLEITTILSSDTLFQTGFNITVKVWSKDHRHNRDDLVDSFSVDINYLNGSSQIDENRTQ